VSPFLINTTQNSRRGTNPVKLYYNSEYNVNGSAQLIDTIVFSYYEYARDETCTEIGGDHVCSQ